MNEFELKVTKTAQVNAFKLHKLMTLADISNYYMAGGCFQKVINDYDIFPIGLNDFNKITENLRSNIVFKSKNAITVKYDNITVQFCKYHHNSLKELVDSFDFSHCQIGAKIENFTQVKEIYASENYRMWKLTDEDNYIGSVYPLSSLLRCYKYKDKFLLGNYKNAVINTLIDIIKRGFEDYDDFKDQLDAIDLSYMEDSEDLKELFELLRKDK